MALEELAEPLALEEETATAKAGNKEETAGGWDLLDTGPFFHPR